MKYSRTDTYPGPTYRDPFNLWPFNESDLRIDVYRDAGACPNPRCSVKIVHMPTGEVADCALYTNQFQNKTVAMARLVVKLVGAVDGERFETRRDSSNKDFGG